MEKPRGQATTAGQPGRRQASLRESVRLVVSGVVGPDGRAGAPRHSEAAKERLAAAAFERLASGAGPAATRRHGEAATCDSIAAHLLQQSNSDASRTAAAGHARFQGLCDRLRASPGLGASSRSAALRLVFLLREGGTAAKAPITPGRPTLLGEAVEPLKPSAEKKASAAGVSLVSHLGWSTTAASGLKPTSISEAQLLRDVLHALQGVSSSCFKFSRSAGRFEIDPSVILSRPARTLTQQILELADSHARLCASVNSTLEAETGHSLVHQSLCEALREQLRDYYKVLALLMARADTAGRLEVEDKAAADQKADLSLRRLWAWLQDPMERMHLLIGLCDTCRSLRGGAVASAINGFAHVGDSATQNVAKAILRHSAGPLLSMIRTWMTEGELRDPYGEFFVCADGGVPMADLWNRMYSLEIEMVPSFFPMELARKILLTGKSVNFIRLCMPGQDWLPVGSSEIALPGDSRGSDDILGILGTDAASSGSGADALLMGLSARVEQAAHRANQHLVSLMRKQYKLDEHCHALRMFLLLGQGDFVESLIDYAEEDLSKDAGELFRHHLTGIVDMAIRQSNAQFAPPDTIARLGVKLLKPSAGERGWDVVLLEYVIDSPLHVVFTPVAMQQYDRAFVFLWKLRRVSHALASCWRRHMSLHRHLVSCGRHVSQRDPGLALEMRQTLHKCTMLRNEIHFFIQNVQSYVMSEVLEAAWAKLQGGWRNCADLDQVISEHQRYLACIEDGAFLAPKAEQILTSLTALFGLSLEFTKLHDQVCSTSFEAIEVLGGEPDGPLPFARSLAECRAQIDQVGSRFHGYIQSLLKTLEGQTSLRHLSADLRFLLCRLDFNGYYEQRRSASLSG